MEQSTHRRFNDWNHAWICGLYDLFCAHCPPSYQGSGKLQILLDEWMATKGDWKSSRLYKQMTIRSMERKHGARVWLTKMQLTQKYGCAPVAQQIIDSKRSDAETFAEQSKPHPDCPDSEAGYVVDMLPLSAPCLLCSFMHFFMKSTLPCHAYVLPPFCFMIVVFSYTWFLYATTRKYGNLIMLAWFLLGALSSFFCPGVEAVPGVGCRGDPELRGHVAVGDVRSCRWVGQWKWRWSRPEKD